jgi:hypothetical protein
MHDPKWGGGETKKKHTHTHLGLASWYNKIYLCHLITHERPKAHKCNMQSVLGPLASPEYTPKENFAINPKPKFCNGSSSDKTDHHKKVFRPRLGQSGGEEEG